ncbi:MAG: GNAT family N-acetyltransferase [Abditibacteriota bacterium]|nr:GNAT family N-acetyltransferase [Abditibacteriota bacterium]
MTCETAFVVTVAGSERKTCLIRPLRREEYGLLRRFTYEAIFIPAGAEPPPFDIVDRPELAVYYRDFGAGRGDTALVAEIGGRVAGAAWARIMKDYGHLDDDRPSLAVSMMKEYRSLGIGSRLLKAVLGLLGQEGFAGASLSVQKANYAVRMYEKQGFRTVAETADEYIMQKVL